MKATYPNSPGPARKLFAPVRNLNVDQLPFGHLMARRLRLPGLFLALANAPTGLIKAYPSQFSVFEPGGFSLAYPSFPRVPGILLFDKTEYGSARDGGVIDREAYHPSGVVDRFTRDAEKTNQSPSAIQKSPHKT
ncbi:hypothetical protein RFM26_01480 [Mesorhizobium sp. VK23B]|uniref:Uncharacterized protein n=1 Tax=Mesorhizobium dulcispinae TaxID=3072316 RepID=A0ABU4X7G5_9HYPH|nr:MULTISPECIES: hypothetical protein [unclassified Mesorhizobium]MDX8464356.1 hypothetical protein [Mesorhizobium sp. VK23B]MDX8470742.1 hypothetical protein [Mesorhizobium sp. VK23A]